MADASNPFEKLAKAFAEKNAGAGKGPSGQSASLPSASSPGAPQRGERKKAASEEDEDALFLNAVSRIKPLNGKRGAARHGAESPGDTLAARIRDTLDAQGVTAKAAASRPVGGPLKGNAGDGRGTSPRLSENEEFLAAMGPGTRERGAAHSRNPAPEQKNGRAFFQGEAAPDEESAALFSKAMQGVAPVNGKGRDVAAPAAPAKVSPLHDPAKALREVLEGKVEFALHHTDEYLEGYVVGVDPLVLSRLRAGQYSPEKHLDLHGMNAAQAHDALTWFIRDAYQRGLRTVVVITGRGKNSPDGVGVLRPLLQQWLCREPFKRVVLAFCTAKAHDGGPGAVYVLLRKYKKSRGKIVWEHTPSDEDFPA